MGKKSVGSMKLMSYIKNETHPERLELNKYMIKCTNCKLKTKVERHQDEKLQLNM